MSDHWVHWIRIISNKWSFYLVFPFSTNAQAYFVNTHTQVTTERTNGIRKQIPSIRQQYVSRMWFFKNRISCSSVRQCSNDLVFFFSSSGYTLARSLVWKRMNFIEWMLMRFVCGWLHFTINKQKCLNSI